MTRIISISLTDEEKEWLDDMELSPTFLMKHAVAQMMGGTAQVKKRNKELSEKIEALAGKLGRALKVLAKHELMQEYENEPLH